VEGLRNRTANAWGIQFTRRSVSRSEAFRGDGDQCADHGQLILVSSMMAVRKVVKIGAVKKNDEMAAHCRDTALRTLYRWTLCVV